MTMTTRNDFTTVQWQALRNAPQLVAITTAAAGNSGLFGSLSEGIATASKIAEAAKGDYPLLREISDKNEIRIAQDEIRSLLKEVKSKDQLDAFLKEVTTNTITNAVAALDAKGLTADAQAYRSFLGGIAEKVASASKEGGFLGIGGERISEGERQFIDSLHKLLGTPAGAYQAEVKLSFFDRILDKLGIKRAQAAPATPAPMPAPAATAAPAPTPAAPPKPAAIPVVDVLAQLEKLAAANPQKLNWKTSIVDLLKLLDIDSSYEARKALATELGIPVDLMAESARMNIWLHKTVLRKIAENGGNIPQELLD
jgi:hypothetical protein